MIGIWDIDYYHKKTGFNTDCMKISSFFKQYGESVHLITTHQDINRPYGELYITKRDPMLPNPPAVLMRQCHVKVWGKGFKFFVNWTIPDHVLGCRCDYLLYPEKNTKIERAEMIQFFNSKGRPLPLIQDHTNTFKQKRTLVVDENFWEAQDKNIIKALVSLKKAANLSFLYPISAAKLFSNENITEKFYELEFTSGAKLQFVNDLGYDYRSMEKIIDFIAKMRDNKHIRDISTIQCPAITKNHSLDTKYAWYDLERCLMIMDLGKKNKVIVKFHELESRIDTPYFVLFESIINWSHTSPRKSYIDWIAHPIAMRYNCLIEDIYRDNRKWDDVTFYEIMRILARRKNWIEKYCLRKWGDNFTTITTIDWKNMKEST